MILLRCRPYFVSPLFGSDFIESLGTVAGSLPCSLSTPRRMIGVFVSVLGLMVLGVRRGMESATRRGLAAVFVEREDDELVEHITPGFEAMLE